MKELTAKQRALWDLKSAGKTRPEIAVALGISENLVSKTITVIHKKLGIPWVVLTETKNPQAVALLMDKATDPFPNITRAIKDSGLPESTGRAFLRRLQGRYGNVPQVVRGLKTADLIRRLEERIDLALEYMDEKVIAEASYRDLAMGTAQLIEKRQLLRGEPTQIVSDAERKKLNELLPALLAEAKRRGITVEGQVTEKVVNPT